MEVTVQIPDEIAQRLRAEGRDLSRSALEALALEEYRSGRITKPELRHVLGFETRFEVDDFLKSHKVYEDYTADEINREVEALKRLGF